MAQSLGRVAVLLGGFSPEREVSLMSGQAVLEALQSAGVDAIGVDVKSPDVSSLAHFDRVFIALHGGWGENGGVQQQLNALHVPYTGPGAEASRVGADKELTKACWRKVGLPVPNGRVVSGQWGDDELARLIQDLNTGDGLIVKPVSDGSSLGLTKLRTPTVESLKAAIALAQEGGRYALVESLFVGREFTVGIIGGQALPIIEIKAPEGNYDFQNKYYGDAVRYECPAMLSAEMTERIQRACEQAFQSIGARGWSRIDVLANDKGEFVLLEINTSPGMTSHSLVPMAARAVGMDFPTLCQRLLSLAQTDDESV